MTYRDSPTRVSNSCACCITRLTRDCEHAFERTVPKEQLLYNRSRSTGNRLIFHLLTLFYVELLFFMLGRVQVIRIETERENLNNHMGLLLLCPIEKGRGGRR